MDVFVPDFLGDQGRLAVRRQGANQGQAVPDLDLSSAHGAVALFAEDRFELLQYPELSQEDCAGGIAVEGLNPAVLDAKDVAARRIHPLAGPRAGSKRQLKRPPMRSLPRPLDEDRVSDREEPQ